MTPPLYSIYWLHGLETIEIEYDQELPSLKPGAVTAFDNEAFELVDFQVSEEAREVIMHLSPIKWQSSAPWFMPSAIPPIA